ncbi:MAG: hypothetical protein IKP06_04385 [Elusimicrobiaceae bacterium]|nr:hypothetical protein [Elusimicrobiaceae bacterium]
MKRIFVLFVCYLAASTLWAQSPAALKNLPKGTKADRKKAEKIFYSTYSAPPKD